jgi:hypothetical protein
MTKGKKDKSYLPYYLSFLYILFVGIFAFDVFGEGLSPLGTAIALFMHLIPCFILITITVISWKNRLIGGMLYILLSIAFTLGFSTYREIISFLIISAPPLIIGVLLLPYSKKLKNKKSSKLG